ncbi:pyridoxamine 5'-phosphate oxidase family protein [Patulibacter sp.]|uniref:pyridoxamine 5'-phosphate oxidase family protein n=1 Tax=Patulibacter sp. TaxID=1912859 RepID=UPI002722E7A3|nr:pyridoxamine 5'-phosphate oxidase family protein [Patulibacter sp.]MDO9410816.1 pyridoxamine 5'-phosphate oxidase family protein [Patulibacter sp.]
MAFVPHAGERAVQVRAGESDMAARVARGITREIPAPAAAFLAGQPMIVVAARDDDGAVWCSLLTGAPGFARAADERTVEVDASPSPGDPLATVLGRTGTPVGLLAIEPATRRRMRVNGRTRARVARAGVAGVDRSGAAGPAVPGLIVGTEEVYANCPKYISRRSVVGVHPDRTGSGAPAMGHALTGEDRAQVASADAFFVASTHADTGADASHRGGRPGFVTVHDDRTLSFPDYTGNALFMTLGNLASDPHVGLLFPDWRTGDLLFVSGTAAIDWSPERAAAHPGAQRVVDVRVERTVRLPGASPLRWGPPELSRFDP